MDPFQTPCFLFEHLITQIVSISTYVRGWGKLRGRCVTQFIIKLYINEIVSSFVGFNSNVLSLKAHRIQFGIKV